MAHLLISGRQNLANIFVSVMAHLDIFDVAQLAE